MPLTIDIFNKQRRIPVQVPKIRKTVELLAGAVFAELRATPLKRLKRSVLNDFEKRGSLSLMLVSNDRIREMNREWRGKDYATDVLSFPLALDDDGAVSIFPGDEMLELGQLVISLEKTQEQAAEYGHGFDREFAFLFVHGMLHVLGFDHITKAQEKEMFGRQSKILSEAGFPR